MVAKIYNRGENYRLTEPNRIALLVTLEKFRLCGGDNASKEETQETRDETHTKDNALRRQAEVRSAAINSPALKADRLKTAQQRHLTKLLELVTSRRRKALAC